MNDSSLLLRLMLKCVGSGFPIRFAAGIGVGTFTKMIVDALARSTSSLFLGGLASYQMYYFQLVSVAFFFAPILFGKRNAPESVVHMINTIQVLLDRAKFSKTHEQLFWRSVLEKYIAAAKPDFSETPNVIHMAADTFEEAEMPNDK